MKYSKIFYIEPFQSRVYIYFMVIFANSNSREIENYKCITNLKVFKYNSTNLTVLYLVGLCF